VRAELLERDAIGSSTSSGASPRTRNAPAVSPEVPRRLDLGGAVPGRRHAHDGVAAGPPDDRVRIAAIVPPAVSPAAICTVRRASAYSPVLDQRRRTAGGRREHAERGAERAQQVRLPALASKCVGRPSEPHQLEDHVRRVALRHVGELFDLDRLDVRCKRQQRERSSR
jgi:hypothetical protein